MKKNILFITPDDLFQQIERIVTKSPERLNAGNWHELKNGQEAFTPEQILDPKTRHCLAGWIVTLTPRAPEYERGREDVDEFANEILRANDRLPIPLAIFKEENDTLLKIIKGRASEERAQSFHKAQYTFH